MRGAFRSTLALMIAGAALCGLYTLGRAQETPAAAPSSNKPAIDPDALERSLEMLQLQWEMTVLETYWGQAKFYIPPQWPTRIQDRFQVLALEAGKASEQRLKDMDAWVEASRAASKNQTLEMYKLAEERIKKLVGLGKKVTGGQQAAQEWETFRLQSRKNALEVARFMEGITERLRAVNKGTEGDAWLDAFSLRWEQNARRIFGESVRDTDKLVTMIARHEQTRMKLETRMKYLKGVEDALAWSKTVQGVVADPSGKALEKIEELAQAEALKWMKERYLDIDDDAFKAVYDDVKGVVTDAVGLVGTLNELDEDPALKQNPTALAMVKKCAIIGAVYKQTLGRIKNMPGAELLAPAFDFLDFYGDALGAVPAIARQMQGFVDQAQQGAKIQALDAFAIVKSNDVLWEIAAMRELGLLVATDSQTSDRDPNAHYYVLVDPEVIPRGYATFDFVQFARMTESIAYERFINAPREASRGPYDWATDFVFGGRNTSLTSANVSTAYVDDVKARAKKTPFTPKQLVDLAEGQSVELNKAMLSHASLESRAESELEARADEMMLRKTTGKDPSEVRPLWNEYVALLRSHGVALSPRQIMNLFSHYHGSDAGKAQVGKYLRALTAEREARVLGTANIGVPVILLPNSTSVEPSTTTNLTADVVVSNLQPGRAIEGRAQWHLPEWAGKIPEQPVTLENGVAQVDCPLTVPQGVDLQPFEVRVVVTVPSEPGANAVAKAAARMGEDAAAQAAAAAGGAESPAVEQPEPPREYHGANDFDVESQAGAPQLVVRRAGSYTALEISSDSLAGLKEDSPNGVRLSIYYSTNASGPFQKLDGDEFVSRDSQKIPDSENLGSTGWLDNDTYVRIFSRPFVPEDQPQPMGPFYFQVGQTLESGFETVGEEVRSKIVGPSGRAYVRVGEAVEGGVLQATRQDKWWAFSVALCLEDQGVDIQGAEAVVTCGGWKGHFYTSRTEGKYQYGSSRPDITGSNVAVRVPIYGGPNVQVTITGRGFSATQSFMLPDIAQESAQWAANAQQIRESAARNIQGKEQAVKSARETQAANANRKPEGEVKDLLSAHTWAGPGASRSNAYIKRIEQYEIPAAKADAAYSAAAAVGDWAAALAASNEHVGLIKISYQIRREELQGEIPEIEKVLAFPGESGGLRKHYEQTIEQHKKELAELEKRQAFQLANLYYLQAEPAMLAGDAGSSHTAAMNRVAALQAAGLGPDSMTDALFSAADAKAMLAGDRAGAEQLWREAWAKVIAAAPADYRAQQQETYNNLTYFPAYFPEKAAK